MGSEPKLGAQEEGPGPTPMPLPVHAEWHGKEGSPILLVHGFSTNGYTWNRWTPTLAKEHRLLVVDLKGAGSSPKPPDQAYGPRDQAELLYRLILQHDLRDLTLVGHSLGGGIALLTALRLLNETEPRLKRLALVAGAAYPQPIPRFIALAARPFLGPLALKILPASFIIRAGLRRAYFRPEKITRSQVEAYAEPLRKKEGRRALSKMAGQIIPPELDQITPRYRKITVPTLLIWGRQDIIVPLRIGERLARELPQAELHVLAECGHMPQEEEPETSLKVFLDFLAVK